jgi:hypothetical protein
MSESTQDETTSLDLLDRIPGMFRLLDLVEEAGSRGINQSLLLSVLLILSLRWTAPNIVIAQESVARFANRIQPGSYRSLIQVNPSFAMFTSNKLRRWISTPWISSVSGPEACTGARVPLSTFSAS